MGAQTMEMIAKSKSEAGFTLTEMMVVVAIIGFLTAFAIPEYVAWSSKARLRDATALVASSINLARVGAINQGTPVTVTVCYQTPTCPATTNPTPNQVTVFFRNPAGVDIMTSLALDSLIGLTDASNNPIGGGVNSPQDVQFSSVGIRQFTGTNANNLCVSNTGAYTACGGGNAQVFNFRNLNKNLNYRVVVGPSGKTTWCYAPTCAGN